MKRNTILPLPLLLLLACGPSNSSTTVTPEHPEAGRESEAGSTVEKIYEFPI